MGVIKGDTRSLDYSSYRALNLPSDIDCYLKGQGGLSK